MPSSRIEVHNGKYIDDQMANGVPDGGTTGQVLAKASNDDYDTQWVTGGGSSPLTTKGDIYTRDSSADTRLPVGLDTQVLIADSTTTTGLKWGSNTAPTPLGYYGAWQDDQTQSAASSNVGYAMIFRVADVTPNGISIANNGSGNPTRITFANTGIYNLQFGSQFQNTDTQEQDVTIWLRKNGIDVPGSSGFMAVVSSHGGVPGHVIAAWNYVLDIVAGDYYELIWSTTDHVHVTMQYYAAGNPPPAAASVILTVTQQSGIMAGTGITAINSLTGSAQTLITGTSGTDFAISSTGTSHTFNIPTASSSNRGLLSTTDWSTFNGKQNALSGTGFVKISGTTISYDNSTYLTSAITSLGGLTGATQTFATGTTGTDFAISSSGTIHTFNLPTASATNRGALSSSDWTTFNNKQSSLTFSTGLTNSSGTVTSNLSVGVSGGQSVIGGTAASDNLTLSSTSNATKGKVLFGTSAYDEVNNRLGIGTSSPSTPLHVNRNLTASGALARIGLINGTLTAAANNDVLVGFDITPTFTNGAFTGVSNYVLRMGGHIGIGTANAFGFNYANFNALTSNNGIAANFTPSGTPTGSAYVFQFNKTSSTTNVNALLFVGGGSAGGGNSANKHVISSTADGTATGQPIVIRTAATGTNWGSVNDHLTVFSTGNVVIQSASASATDNGFKLDVNGTGRYQSTLTTSGNMLAYTAKTSAYTATGTDEIIACNSTSAAFTITLPTAVGRTGQKYVIKKTDSSANAVTVGTTSSQTIDASTTYSLATQWKYVEVVSNGANWLIISNN